MGNNGEYMRLYFDYRKTVNDIMTCEQLSNNELCISNMLEIIATNKMLSGKRIRLFIDLIDCLKDAAFIQGGELEVIWNENELFGTIHLTCTRLFITPNESDFLYDSIQKLLKETDSILIQCQNGFLDFDILMKLFE